MLPLLARVVPAAIVLVTTAVPAAPPAAPPAAARAVTPAPGGRWLPPLGGLPPRPVRLFAAPPGPYAAGHRGVDLPGTAGEVVRAPAGGRVLFAGSVAGRPLVVLAHAGGLRSTLEPVAATVAVGDPVAAGQPVGALAPAGSHCLPAACLHWGVRAGGGADVRYLDPLALLAGAGPVRLLPLDGRPVGG